jgi:hypothetical protein
MSPEMRVDRDIIIQTIQTSSYIVAVSLQAFLYEKINCSYIQRKVSWTLICE